MDDRSDRRTWYRWLLTAAAILVGGGTFIVALALAGVPPVLMELLYLPGEPDVASADTLSFAIGVTGAVMLGWGGSLLYIYLDPAMLERTRIARGALIGTLAWFVGDTYVSVSLGAMINVAVNVAFLALLLPPLAVFSLRRG
jgi:hypothetical protein